MNQIVYIAPSEGAVASLAGLIKRLRSFGYSFLSVESSEEIQNLEIDDVKLAIVGIDIEYDQTKSLELVEEFASKFPDIELMAVFSGKLQFDQQVLYDAEVGAVYQYPFEDELIINHIFEIDPVDLANHQLSFDLLARVNVTELKSGDELPFALYVYLPANKKIIPYNHQDQALDDEVLQKFRENSHYSLYVKKTNLHSYYSYCAESLKDSLGGLSGEDYTKKITGQMKALMSGFFDNKILDVKDSGQLIENLGKIVSSLEDQSGSKIDLVEAVNKLASRQLTNYSHAKNMATYCSMFGLMAGIKEPQSLRIGGMLHDLGMMDLPASLLQKEEKDMNDLEYAQFKLHPGNAKLSIIEKGLRLPKVVEHMIMQHHEHSDGSGFPYGLTAKEIHPFAKICAFADVFDTLTSVREGYRQLSPIEAMHRISGRDGDAASKVFDEAFHGPIVDSFLEGSFVVPEIDSLGNNSESQKSSDQNDSSNVKLDITETKDDLGEVQEAQTDESYGSVKSAKQSESGRSDEDDKMAQALSDLIEEEVDEKEKGIA